VTQVASTERPLRGRHILVTQSADLATRLVAPLEALGARVLAFPAIEIVAARDVSALERALSGIERYDWLVLTSANGVRSISERLEALGIPRGEFGRQLRVACVGPATSRTFLDTFPGRRVHVQPPADFRAEGLVEAVLEAQREQAEAGEAARSREPLTGQRFLLPTSDRARDVIGPGLRALGGVVDVVVAYRTTSAPGLSERLRASRPSLDLVVFASPSAVEAVASAAPELAASLPVAVIGPITEKAALGAGMDVRVVASPSTAEGLIADVRHHLTPRRP
jgi:uroporphyrinogen III methyltransferase/synthase